MVCRPINVGGMRGFACGPKPRQKRCECGAPATLECDWKVGGKTSGTCDKPICKACTHVPAPGKDLCPKHAAAWKARQGERR